MLNFDANVDVTLEQGFMAYLHCRTRFRTLITVLSRNFALVQIQTLIPWLKYSKIETSVPKMGTETIWETIQVGIRIRIQTNVKTSA